MTRGITEMEAKTTLVLDSFDAAIVLRAKTTEDSPCIELFIPKQEGQDEISVTSLTVVALARKLADEDFMDGILQEAIDEALTMKVEL